MNTIQISKAILFFLTSLALTLSSYAHHGGSARFDNENPIIFTAVVTGKSWTPPHETLQVRVQDQGRKPVITDDLGVIAPAAKAAPERISPVLVGSIRYVQFPPAARWFPSLNEAMIKQGDTIQLITFPNCEKPTELRVQWIKTARDGAFLRIARPQLEAPRCL